MFCSCTAGHSSFSSTSACHCLLYYSSPPEFPVRQEIEQGPSAMVGDQRPCQTCSCVTSCTRWKDVECEGGRERKIMKNIYMAADVLFFPLVITRLPCPLQSGIGSPFPDQTGTMPRAYTTCPLSASKKMHVSNTLMLQCGGGRVRYAGARGCKGTIWEGRKRVCEK